MTRSPDDPILSVFMSVMMSFFDRDWHYAAVGDVALFVFELDGGVVDVVAFGEALFHLMQNDLAL